MKNCLMGILGEPQWSFVVETAELRPPLPHWGSGIETASLKLSDWGCPIEAAQLRLPHWDCCIEAVSLRLPHQCCFIFLAHWDCLIKAVSLRLSLKLPYWGYLVEALVFRLLNLGSFFEVILLRLHIEVSSLKHPHPHSLMLPHWELRSH